MPQSDRRTRLDGYAKPLPELTEASCAITIQDAMNQKALSMLHALVQDTCRAVMRHGWYGRVHIRFRVIDGMLQSDIYTSLDRNWKNQPEPR